MVSLCICHLKWLDYLHSLHTLHTVVHTSTVTLFFWQTRTTSSFKTLKCVFFKVRLEDAVEILFMLIVPKALVWEIVIFYGNLLNVANLRSLCVMKCITSSKKGGFMFEKNKYILKMCKYITRIVDNYVKQEWDQIVAITNKSSQILIQETLHSKLDFLCNILK